MKTIILSVMAACLCVAQPRSISSVSTTAPVDFGSATSTAPIKYGTSVPGSCSAGQLYLKTNATSGQQIYACESGVFVAQGGAGGSSVFAKPIWFQAATSNGAGTFAANAALQLVAAGDTGSSSTSRIGMIPLPNGGGTAVLTYYLPTTYNAGDVTFRVVYYSQQLFDGLHPNAGMTAKVACFTPSHGSIPGSHTYTSGSTGSVATTPDFETEMTLTVTAANMTTASCAPGSLAYFAIARDTGDAFTGEIRVLGVEMTITY